MSTSNAADLVRGSSPAPQISSTNVSSMCLLASSSASLSAGVMLIEVSGLLFVTELIVRGVCSRFDALL
jgi:hypothetical protein